MYRLILVTLTAGLIAGANLAIAHEKDEHGKKPGIVKKEQKPWGVAGDPKAVKRTIEIAMSDAMRFTPDRITVRHGETIKLVVRNAGGQLHELVLGTKNELDAHAALMMKHPGMEHDEPYMAHVSPGKSSELIWHFNRAGEFDFACLIPGHYQAGMVGKIVVNAR